MELSEKIIECNQSVVNAWADSASNISNPPWLVYISVTNLCNNRCKVCARSKAMRADKGVMDFEVFDRIVEQLPDGVKKVYLMKQGEPFINKNLEIFGQHLRKKKPEIDIALHTNGILAKQDRVKKILPLINSMGVSISAITPEIYKKVHGTDSFNQVIKNLGDISKLLLQIPKAERPHVFIDYVQQSRNQEEDEVKIVDFFSSNFPGLSSVDFHWVFNFQGEIEEGNMKIYDELPYDIFPCCTFPWATMTFCHDGKVSYCFVEPRENRFLGNINNQSFEEIWNGEEYRNFRSKMAKKMFGELAEDRFGCHKCTWLWSMRSQSPRNLNGGYSSKLKSQNRQLRFGDLLDMPQNRLFGLGIESYLEGEIHQAIGCFNLLLSTSKDKTILQASQNMLEKCQKILKKYENLSLWQEMLEKEGISAEQKQCRYYPIND